jgi:Fic family protein
MRGSLVKEMWHSDGTAHAPARYRRPCSYEAFIPDPLASAKFILDAELVGAVSDAESAIHKLNASADPALKPLARLLLRTESIASSKVEGLQVDARSLARSEARHDIGQRVGSASLEVISNIDAMQFAVEEAAATPLTVDAIVDIHRVLLENSPHSGIAGMIRDEQNWIGGNDYNPCGADFVPPPPGELPGLLADLVDFCNDDSLAPLVQAAVAHAQFETIHPFADGNGRTGRALIHILLRRRGAAPFYVPPISVIMAAQKQRYVDSLVSFREGRDARLIEVFAVAATRAADLATSYLGQVLALQDEWREKLRRTRKPRSDAAAWAIIDVLPAYPVISVPTAVAATGRVRSAVNTAMSQLHESGVLESISENERNRSWEASGLLDLLIDLESATPLR